MKSITVPIGEAGERLPELVEEVKHGAKVTITSNGHPEAVLSPAPKLSTPWRVDKPDDPGRYGDLQSPVMEDWK
jgi:prevent-host-death family protein